MQIDVIVAGGGASGMVAAICCARRGKKVLLIEKNARLGRKLSVTGNGKCNLTNRDLSTDCYHTSCEKELEEILALYGTDRILSFFREIGLPCRDRNGYFYPVSEQAAAVVQLLEAEMKRLSVEVHIDERITSITKATAFLVQTERSTYTAGKLVMALGGAAAPVYGAEDSGYQFLNILGHYIVPIKPALTGLSVREKYLKKISGVRLEANITLQFGNSIQKEKGEIIFTDKGVSGIPVFQISRYAADYTTRDNEATLTIDVLPNQSSEEMAEYCNELIHHNHNLPLEYLFRGSCNHKLVYTLLTENHFSAEQDCGSLSMDQLYKIINIMKHMKLTVIGTRGFEHAQVTAGGVPLNEINIHTMESVKVPGLYITGELLDADGICGGYNLHFAWTSGMIAGEHI